MATQLATTRAALLGLLAARIPYAKRRGGDFIASLLEMLVGVMSTVEEGPLRLSVEALVREVAWMRLVLRGLVDDVADARRRREHPGGQQAGVPHLASMPPSALHHLETTLARALGGAREDMPLAELVKAALEPGGDEVADLEAKRPAIVAALVASDPLLGRVREELAAVGADVAGHRAQAAPGQDEDDGVKPRAKAIECADGESLIRDPVDCEDCGGDGCSRCEDSGLICNTCGKAMPRCQCTEEQAHEPGEPEPPRINLDEATEEEHYQAIVDLVKARGEWPRRDLEELIRDRLGPSRFKHSTFAIVLSTLKLTDPQWSQLRKLSEEDQPTFGKDRARVQGSLVAKGMAADVDERGKPVRRWNVTSFGVFRNLDVDRCRITDAGRERLSLGRGPR